MTRLFVAIDLPDPVKDALAPLAFGLPGARWVPRDQLHVTLSFIGEVDPGDVADVREALRGVEAAAFEASLLGLGHFPPRGEPKVVWAGVRGGEELAALQRHVERALHRAGFPPEKRKFHAHVTLARLRDTPTRRVGEYLAGNGLFSTPPFPVTEFLLYSSVLGSSGPTHRIEEAYTLDVPD